MKMKLVAELTGKSVDLSDMDMTAGPLLNGELSMSISESSEVGTRYFFPDSLIAKSLFCTHGLLSLNRYFLGFQGSLTAKSLVKKQWFAIVKFAKTLNR